MSADLSWEPEFCLACDRQTDGATYCSESCRLSDFEKTSSTTSTPAGTPGVAAPCSYWPTSRQQSKFYLPPAYDFSNAQPYGSTPLPQSYLSQRSESSSSSSNSTRVLTPSSSHSSLCSLRSTSSAGSEGTQLSDKAKKQLRDYASSFEHARLQQQRRRSY
ncbi:uncharacterized protein F4822DRAFT_258064 [Hypoxylon trugodes]|uniref:uncharacterized protein n=1 Tax=Hypoxylon trugodes TaxID=326681 RepID=UPI00219AE9F5|nr:uncharacterized protein F4822DRAFT_258064 [Hypoxylon trugodes]KAI1388792.1 hypothetical protein F4822DRAFT_258064 [Hypoxylon trugodes]